MKNSDGDISVAVVETEQAKRAVRGLKTVSQCLGIIVAVIGLVVLVGWLLHIPYLKSLFPGMEPMKVNTAICFIFSGVALWLLHIETPQSRSQKSQQYIAYSLALLIALIGLITLLEYATGWDPGIDQMVVRETAVAPTTSHPGRMAPYAAVNFLMAGLALLLLNIRTPRGYRPSNLLIVVGILISLTVMLGYFYNAAEFKGIYPYTPLAMDAALAFLLIFTGILVARPGGRLSLMLIGDYPGSLLVRLLIPLILILLVVTGWLHLYLEQKRYYSDEFATALFTLLNIVIITVFIVAIGVILYRAELRRRLMLKEINGLNTSLEQKVGERTQGLQESETRFRMLYENAPAGYQSLDPEGRIIEVNHTWLNALGYSRDEVIGRWFADFLTRQSIEIFKDCFPHLLGAGEVHGIELEMIKKDGSNITVSLEGRISRDVLRGTRHTHCLFTDITERKRIEDALKQSEEKYRSLVEHANEGITITQDGKLKYVNPKLAEISGYTVEELMARNLADFIHPEDLELVAQGELRRLRGEQFIEIYSFRAINKWGDIRWMETNSVMVNWENRPATLNFLTDITERKEAQKTIEKQREEYRIIFDSVRPMIAYLNKEGVFLRINKSGANFLGKEPREIVGKTVYDLFPADEADQIIRDNDEAMNSGTAKFGLVRQYSSPVGAKRWANIDRIPYFDDNGNITGIIAFIQDITRRKLAEDKLQESYESLQNSLEDIIGAMAKIVEMKDPYTAGHQIRVAELATAIAVRMNMPDDKVDTLRIAATIHDIGKIYVPSDILSKPGKLSDIEYQIIQTHPQGSYEILKDIDFPWPIAQIVYQHHERLDGSGYPRGLKEGDIMPEAKILAVADTVEAMASHRPYRPAQGIDQALDEISNNRGILYDPEAVDACLELFRGGFEFKSSESVTLGG